MDLSCLIKESYEISSRIRVQKSHLQNHQTPISILFFSFISIAQAIGENTKKAFLQDN